MACSPPPSEANIVSPIGKVGIFPLQAIGSSPAELQNIGLKSSDLFKHKKNGIGPDVKFAKFKVQGSVILWRESPYLQRRKCF